MDRLKKIEIIKAATPLEKRGAFVFLTGVDSKGLTDDEVDAILLILKAPASNPDDPKRCPFYPWHSFMCNLYGYNCRLYDIGCIT